MSSREYLRPASGSHPRTRDAAAHGHYLCSHARHRASTAIDPRDLGADRPGRRLRAGAASVRSTMHEADDPLVVLAAARARFLAHERESLGPHCELAGQSWMSVGPYPMRSGSSSWSA
jgi:hypothetical protein